MNNPYIQRASIWRILTNSTINVISIVFLAFLVSQLWLVEMPYLYLKIIVIALMFIDVAFIVAITLLEYRYSFLVIDHDHISYHQPLNKKKNFEKKLSEIRTLRIASSSLLVEFSNQKVLLDYLAKPKNIMKEIKEKEAI